MKKITPVLIACTAFLFACGDSAENDPVEAADSANEARIENANDSGAMGSVMVDEETAEFFTKAADGGMAEVAAGKMAQGKATNPEVKNFAAMMVTDHTGANAGLKDLAAKKNIVLPDTVSTEHQEHAADLMKKSGREFDKAYMDLQVKDHEKTIELFEDGSRNVKDPEVKSFIDATLPKLQAHLVAARNLQKSL